MAVLCAGIALSLSLAGCGSGKSDETAQGEAGSDRPEAALSENETVPSENEASSADTSETGGVGKDAALNPDEKIELTMWSPSTEADAFHHGYITAIEEFQEAHPNITVTMEVFENETYKQKIQAAAAGNELPDIFYSWQGGYSQTFVEAGKCLDLTPYYEEYQNDLPAAAVGNVTFNGSVYGTAYSACCSGLFYNKKLFEEYDLKVPGTWEEFRKACQAFVDNGISPIVTTSKETWVLAVLHDALALKSAGNEKVVSTLTRSGGSYDDPDFLYAAQQLRELVDMGAFVEGCSGISCAEAETMFFEGNVPMLVSLSLLEPSNYSDTPEDYDFAPFPTVNDRAAATDIVGGPSESLMVSSGTQYPDQAGYAAFELSKRISEVGYEDGAGVSPWLSTPMKEDLSELQKKKEQIITSATSTVLWFNTVMQGDDATEYLSLLEQLFVGDITPEDFVAGMDAQLSR